MTRRRGPRDLPRPSSRPTVVRALLVLPVLVLLAACGDRVVVETSSPAETPYDGPLTRTPVDDSPDVAERGGAAVLALECIHDPANGGGADYDSGLSTVQDDADDALATWIDEDWMTVPDTGYVVERDDGDRVLLSYDVDGLTKVAVVAADGIEDWDGDTGWGVESWATCDPSELPDEVVEPTQVWTDDAGVRVPTSEIVSSPGPEHCDWQDLIFLTLGDGDRDSARHYVGDGPAGDLQSMLLATYAAAAPLPTDAEDAGYRRDGLELWLTDDAAYLVAPGDAEGERWPRAREPIACA
jgi:hypothetical protein